MNLKERIASDTKKAMKDRDAAVVSVLRMVSAKVLEKEVEHQKKELQESGNQTKRGQ